MSDWVFERFFASTGGCSESIGGLVSGAAHTTLCPFNIQKTPSDYDFLLPQPGSPP